MTVRELKEELTCYDDDMEVVMLPTNSMYADGINGCEINELIARR